MMLWLNGRLMPVDEARIDPADRGLLLGDGLFETLRVRRGTIAHRDRHLARLQAGARFFEFPSLDHDVLRRALDAVRDAGGLAEGVLRLTLTRGCGPRGVLPPALPVPTLLVTAAPPSPTAGSGLRLCVATRTRRNEFSPLARFKTVNYLDGIIARQEARAAGADDALLRNTAGRIAEATAANLLWRAAGRWFTPPVGDGALPGIRRSVLLERGLVAEAPLDVPDLARIEAAVLCSSLGLRAVGRIDTRDLDPDAVAMARFAQATDQ